MEEGVGENMWSVHSVKLSQNFKTGECYRERTEVIPLWSHTVTIMCCALFLTLDPGIRDRGPNATVRGFYEHQ